MFVSKNLSYWSQIAAIFSLSAHGRMEANGRIRVTLLLLVLLLPAVSAKAVEELQCNCSESEVCSPDHSCIQFIKAPVAFFNNTYEFRTGGLEPDGCSGWIFVNNAGLRTDLEVRETDKYSFTEKGDLVLKQVEFGDGGRYYCRRAFDGTIHYEIQLDVHKHSELRINLTSLTDTTATLDIMFNIYPNIQNLWCNSRWIPTTVVDNEDSTSDVHAILTLNMTGKKLEVQCVTKLVCEDLFTFDTVILDLTNQSEQARNKSDIGPKVTAITNRTGDHREKGDIDYRPYFLGFGIPGMLLMLLFLILLACIAFMVYMHVRRPQGKRNDSSVSQQPPEHVPMVNVESPQEHPTISNGNLNGTL